MQAVALGPTAPLATSSLKAGAGVRAGRGVSAALFTVVAILLAVVLGRALNAYRDPASTVVASPSASRSLPAGAPSSTPSSNSPCPLPTSRPTYLPFATTTPAVEYSYAAGHGLRYEGTDERVHDTVYLSLERDVRTVVWAGQGRRLVAGGRTVELLWIGDPSIGAVDARWVEGTGACTEHVASLVLHTGNQAEIEAQLIRVIDSLRP